MDWGTLVVAGVMAASNLGGMALLAKRYAARVDKHDEVIPEMLGTIKALKDGAEATSRCLDELYTSRNKTTEDIARLDERQESQKDICNERWGSGEHPRRRKTDHIRC